MLPVLAYVDEDLRLIVQGGSEEVRTIAFEAARASRGDNSLFELGPDGPDALKVCLHASFRATPVQLHRIVAEWMRTAEEAAIRALRSAGYDVRNERP